MRKNSPSLEDQKNGEEILDGTCLNSLFEEQEMVESMVKAPSVTKKKPKENKKSTIFLHPMKFVDGAIECKVKCKDGSTLFSKAKVILTLGLNEKEVAIIKETMAKVLKIELFD